MIETRGLTDAVATILAGATGTDSNAGLFDAGENPSGAHTASPRQEAALRRARTLGTLLDDAVRIPGTNFRVGLDPLVGVLPVGGDTVAGILSLYPILEAYRFDAPRRTLARMLLLVAIDTVVGSIPVLGTLFDAVWKANKWNVRTLERQLHEH